MSKPENRKEYAIKLRNEGYSYSYITKITGISKSTLSGFLSKIPFSPNEETIAKIGRARAGAMLSKHKAKLNSINTAKREAKMEIGVVDSRDLLMLGLGLYMGEGSKSLDLIRIVNSNYKVIRLAVRWFMATFGLGVSNFAIRLHLYPDNNEDDCTKFWAAQLGIPKSQFQRPQIDRRSKKGITKRGMLPYGTAHLTVKSNKNKQFGVFLARKISAMIDEVSA